MDSIIDNDKMDLSIFEEWVENREAGDKMPQHIFIYQEQLDLIRGWFYNASSPERIKRKLRNHYPEMSETTARERINDAVNYFYLDKSARKESWLHVFAEKQWQLAEATLLSATEPAHFEIASRIFERAKAAKMEAIPDDPKIPLELLEKKMSIYTLKAKEVGLPERNRRELSNEIDSFLALSEGDKLKLKQDLGVEPREMFNYEDPHGQEES